jgi:DNA-binding transcriptional LysR family regulator
VSRALVRLRRIFDDPLFIRTGTGMTPTPHALSLQGAVAKLLADASALAGDRPAFSPQTDTRAFTVAMADSTQATLLPPLLRRLSRDAPKLDLAIVPLPDDKQRALESGALDLSVGGVQPHLTAVRRRSLFRETFVCIMRRGHEAARGAFSVADYCALQHVAVTLGDRVSTSPVADALTRLGAERRVALRVPSFFAAALVVARSDLVMTAPARVAASVADGFDLVSRPAPFPIPHFDIVMLWHESRDRDPAHRWLREVIVAAVA